MSVLFSDRFVAQVASVAETANTHGVHDYVRHGPRSLKDEVTAVHPLEPRLKNWAKTRQAQQDKVLMDSFGMYMPIRLNMERSLVTPHPLPGQVANTLLLDIVTGRDGLFGFEDYLSDPPCLPLACLEEP